MRNVVLNCDSVEGLKQIPDGTVELTVTSPPYGSLRTYGHGKGWDFEGTAKELYRVTCEGGVVCWNIGDQVIDGSETLEPFRQGLFFLECGFRMHDRMVYHKRNFSNPEKVRYHQVFEDVFVLSKGAPRTFNPIRDKVNKSFGETNWGVNSVTQRDGSKEWRKKNVSGEFGMRGNVWEGKTRAQEEGANVLPHPAMMPMWLARDLILSWSNKGDLVCDPFVGSGTVTELAKRLGRDYIGIDISNKYVKELIEPRLANISPLFA